MSNYHYINASIHLTVTVLLPALTEFIYLFGVLRRFQHCTGHITMGSWKGRGNQYIEFARVVYCKLPTNGKQLPAFPLKAVTGIEPRPQRWKARVLPLCHHGPSLSLKENGKGIVIRSVCLSCCRIVSLYIVSGSHFYTRRGLSVTQSSSKMIQIWIQI